MASVSEASRVWPVFMGSPRGFREQGNMAVNFLEHGNKGKIKLGTREQKHILGNREHQNRTRTQTADR